MLWKKILFKFLIATETHTDCHPQFLLQITFTFHHYSHCLHSFDFICFDLWTHHHEPVKSLKFSLWQLYFSGECYNNNNRKIMNKFVQWCQFVTKTKKKEKKVLLLLWFLVLLHAGHVFVVNFVFCWQDLNWEMSLSCLLLI